MRWTCLAKLVWTPRHHLPPRLLAHHSAKEQVVGLSVQLLRGHAAKGKQGISDSLVAELCLTP